MSAAPIPQGEFIDAWDDPALRDILRAGIEKAFADHAAALAASEARVADLTRERDGAQHRWHLACNDYARELKRAEAAEQSLAEARKDAERWRWLRGNVWAGWMRGEGFFLNCDEPESEWDAAIDALLPKGEGETS